MITMLMTATTCLPWNDLILYSKHQEEFVQHLRDRLENDTGSQPTYKYLPLRVLLLHMNSVANFLFPGAASMIGTGAWVSLSPSRLWTASIRAGGPSSFSAQSTLLTSGPWWSSIVLIKGETILKSLCRVNPCFCSAGQGSTRGNDWLWFCPPTR